MTITRRRFVQSHGILATLFAYLCGVKLCADETDNLGFMLDRSRWNDDGGRREKALADAWSEANKSRHNGGILQMLMCQAATREGEGFSPALSARERKIVAMVIQWLGTNVGSCFLYEASKRMGKEHECYPFHNQNREA